MLAAAVEVSCHLAGDPQWLASFLDGYLGAASAAKKDAWDRCRTEPEHLKTLLADDLGRRSDEELLAAPGQCQS